MKQQTWPFIKRRKYPSGKVGWSVDTRTKDGGERRTFVTRVEAETFANKERIRRGNEGSSAFVLQGSDRADAERALKLLKPHGRTLREAADFFMKHLHMVKREATLSELVAELLDAKERDGLSPRYLKDLRTRLNIFAAAFAGDKVSEFSTARIDDWLRAIPHGAVTRNNYRRLLGVMFSFATKRGYCLSNPAKETAREKQTKKPPGILSVQEAALLLENAEPDIVPAIAIGLFAGLRPESEVMRLDWGRVDFESKLIDVAADKTKGVRKRYVKMSDNLVAWLLPFRHVSGAVSPSGDKYNYMLQRARKAAGIRRWPSDALRHSFASYHVAHFSNAAETAHELGHADVKMLHENYRERVKPAEAARYWQIVPHGEAGEKIINIGT